MSVPNPTMLAAIAQRRQAALLDEAAKAKLTRTTPGRVDQTVTSISDGVFKTKDLEPGMKVRPFVHGKARGSERTVESTKRLGNGAQWHLAFSSAHVDADFAAAYRWYCEALDGATIVRTVKVAALVPYQEV